MADCLANRPPEQPPPYRDRQLVVGFFGDVVGAVGAGMAHERSSVGPKRAFGQFPMVWSDVILGCDVAAWFAPSCQFLGGAVQRLSDKSHELQGYASYPCLLMESSVLDDPRVQNLSETARRLLRRPRPRFRGHLHRWATAVAVPGGVLATAAADGPGQTVSMAVFAVGTVFMLGASALTHWRDWPVERVELMARLDHSAIFVMFATSATPIAQYGIGGGRGTFVLIFAWVGAATGIIAEFVPIHPPRGVVNGVYLGFGASFLAFLPWLAGGLTSGQLTLLLCGGGAYALGALVVGAQWPDHWGETFGYHEIWHLFVVAAAGFHYLLALQLTAA